MFSVTVMVKCFKTLKGRACRGITGYTWPSRSNLHF